MQIAAELLRFHGAADLRHAELLLVNHSWIPGKSLVSFFKQRHQISNGVSLSPRHLSNQSSLIGLRLQKRLRLVFKAFPGEVGAEQRRGL